MNTDQVKGQTKIVAGKVQEKMGKMVGSAEQQLKGRGKQIAGQVQKGVGNIKQAANNVADNLAEEHRDDDRP